jgi:hypothetical protein
MTYKSLGNHNAALGFTGEIKAVLRKSDGAIIPFDPENSDYEEYLEWCKTNTTEAAD